MPHGGVPFPFGKCRICNAKATGVHYGVATCEGCKGFYKRSIPKGDKYRCYFGGNCVISPENRNRCKACRFKKCVKQGMAVEAVKMGRIPKLQKEKALEHAACMEMDTGHSKSTSQSATATGTVADVSSSTANGSIDNFRRIASNSFSFEEDTGNSFGNSAHTASTSSGQRHSFQQPFQKTDTVSCEGSSPKATFSSVRVSHTTPLGTNFSGLGTPSSYLNNILSNEHPCAPRLHPPKLSVPIPGSESSSNASDSYHQPVHNLLPHNASDSKQNSVSLHMTHNQTLNMEESTTILQPQDHCCNHFEDFGSGDVNSLTLNNNCNERTCFSGNKSGDAIESNSDSADYGFAHTDQGYYSKVLSASSICIKDETGTAHSFNCYESKKEYHYQGSGACNTKVCASGCLSSNGDRGEDGRHCSSLQVILKQSENWHEKAFEKLTSTQTVSSAEPITETANTVSFHTPRASSYLSNKPEQSSVTSSPAFTGHTQQLHNNGSASFSTSVQENSVFKANGKECKSPELDLGTDCSNENLHHSSHLSSIGKKELKTGISENFSMLNQSHQSLDSNIRTQLQSLLQPDTLSRCDQPQFMSLSNQSSHSDNQSYNLSQSSFTIPNHSSLEEAQMFNTYPAVTCDPQNSPFVEFSSSSSSNKAGVLFDSIHYQGNNLSQARSTGSSPHEFSSSCSSLPHGSESLSLETCSPNSITDSSFSPSIRLSGDPVLSMDSNLVIILPSPQPELGESNQHYLHQDHMSHREKSTRSSMLSGERPRLSLNLSMLSDHETREAVLILDNRMFTIFEISKRRALRDMYLRMKLKDISADVPPTVATHMDLYPLLMESLSHINENILDFCLAAPGFAKLDSADQQLLLKQAYYDVWMLTSSEYFVDGESYLMVKEGVFYVRRHMEKIIGEQNTQTFHMFTQEFNALGMSHLEVAILCCIQLTAPSHDQHIDLKDVKGIQKLNSFYLDLLVAVVSLIHPNTCSRLLVDIFRLMPFLSEINYLMREYIANFSVEYPPSFHEGSS